MRTRFERQLKQLNDELIEMGNMIERAIQMAVSAMLTQDTDKAKEAIAFDDEIDHMEKELEGLCMKLLLQQQPVASDLRTVSSALKMITDMERIGDQSSDIAEIIMELKKEPYVKKLDHIQEMAKETTMMVVKSVEAFVNKDINMARAVIATDDVVDGLFLEIKRELIQLINEKQEYGEQAADLLMIGKYFERIGDHATNIAEWVEFSITGQHVVAEEER